MLPPGADRVLVRHGDLNTKSEPVRARMERRLVENLRALLADRGIDATVQRQWSRPIVHADTETVEAATAAASDAFGVVSASPVRRVEPTPAAVADAVARTAPAVYDGGTFAVSARRAGEHDFTSRDLEVAAGDAVFDAVAFEAAVDLDDPDVTFFVECRQDDAYVFLEQRPGPGGLPLGTQAPLVALVSGGIDSPVAAYEAMRRGSPVVPVYGDLGAFGGADHEARALETVGTLSRYAPERDMDVVALPLGDAVERLVDAVGTGRMLAFRRLLVRGAEHVAADRGARGIVTGEALGQKSSQTAANLAVTDAATALPVHRPLLTLDKHEIEDRARAIGTYDDATVPAGCNRIVPDQPATRTDLETQREREPDDLFALAERAAAAAERLPVGER